MVIRGCSVRPRFGYSLQQFRVVVQGCVAVSWHRGVGCDFSGRASCAITIAEENYADEKFKVVTHSNGASFSTTLAVSSQLAGFGLERWALLSLGLPAGGSGIP